MEFGLNFFRISPGCAAEFGKRNRINSNSICGDTFRNHLVGPGIERRSLILCIDYDVCVQKNQGSRVMARSSSHFTPRNAFQLRIALRACAFVSFFRGPSWYIRRSTISGPFCSHVNTSPGAAPGSTTRFLLSAVNVIVGLSHTGSSAVNLAEC
jgi:hypothetical protein